MPEPALVCAELAELAVVCELRFVELAAADTSSAKAILEAKDMAANNKVVLVINLVMMNSSK